VASERSNFIRDIIDEDLRSGKHRRVVTRFPPEPNGFPHIGHVKAICVNFGLAQDYGGVCHLRMDDTNPETEDMRYVEAMQRDIRWLGFDWGDKLFYASDYFEKLYQHAERLVERGLAYVDSASEEEIRACRGSLGEPGRPTAGRARAAEENLVLLRRMRAGEFADGAHVLRAKIDLAASNMKMRDPLLYRIRHASHYRTGDAWCIYPMYDWAHPLSDAIEGITHSICTLEFENNRELYDWVLEACQTEARPQQIEMARLALEYTVMSKRKLLRLVDDHLVDGWDDPRLPTIAGLRRRGVSPAALRDFAELVGVARANSMVDVGKLEHAIGDDANQTAPRAMCVLRPLAVELTDYPKDKLETLIAPSFPPDVGKPGKRAVPLGRDLYIDRDDFMAEPVAGFERLAPGRLVRLRHAGVIRCDEVVKDADGAIAMLRCSSVPAEEAGKDVRVIHWVAKAGAVPVMARLYDRLFTAPRPDDEPDFKAVLNPRSLEVVDGALAEPVVGKAKPGDRFQFERVGYFALDEDSRPGAIVVNRVMPLAPTAARAALAAAAATSDAPKPKSAKAQTRPKLMSPIEARTKARERQPELAAAFERIKAVVPEEQADLLTGEARVAAVAEAAMAVAPPGRVAGFLVNVERLDERIAAEPAAVGRAIGQLVELLEGRAITRPVAMQLLDDVLGQARDPGALIAERGLGKADDAAVVAAVDAVLASASAEVARYRAGEQKLFGFLVGQVMKQAGGKADPAAVQKLLRARLA
jgi:glutaminyl-tRNA synthetase